MGLHRRRDVKPDSSRFRRSSLASETVSATGQAARPLIDGEQVIAPPAFVRTRTIQVAAAGAAVALIPAVATEGTNIAAYVWLLAATIVTFWLTRRALHLRVTADADCLRIHQVLGSFRVPWADIEYVTAVVRSLRWEGGESHTPRPAVKVRGSLGILNLDVCQASSAKSAQSGQPTPSPLKEIQIFDQWLQLAAIPGDSAYRELHAWLQGRAEVDAVARLANSPGSDLLPLT